VTTLAERRCKAARYAEYLESYKDATESDIELQNQELEIDLACEFHLEKEKLYARL